MGIMGLLRLTLVVVGLQAFSAVALISKPNAADKKAPSDKKADDKDADKKPSGLSKEWRERYEDVADGVKGLKTPFVNWKSNFAQTPPTPQAEQAQSFLGECSFIGGLLSAQLTPRCCNNVQVITQQKFAQYGLAEDCPAGWDCDADHRTPSKALEGKSLSEFCGEPGCLPRVVKAMASSMETAPGANMMSKVCASLGSSSGEVSALLRENDVVGKDQFLKMAKIGPLDKDNKDKIGEEISKRDKSPKPKLDKKFEVKRAHDKNEVWKAKVAKCKKEVCDVKEKKLVLCETSIDRNNPCYIHCCDDGGVACFPGEALVNKEGVGAIPLGDVNVGDRVLVERSGKLVHEPILAFLHALRNKGMAYVTVTHRLGEFRASSTHLVFVKSVDGGLMSKTVGELQVGDQLLFASGQAIHSLVSSEVVSKMHGHGSTGMFAPLTASGTVVVDGVVASNYASPSHSKHLPHRLAHAFLLPVRFYHQVGFATLLKPFWAWLCHDAGSNEAKYWICQGAGVDQKSAADVEDLHPYLAVFYKGLKVDWLLSAGRS